MSAIAVQAPARRRRRGLRSPLWQRRFANFRANRRGWWLFRADAVVPGCRPGAAGDAGAP